MSDIAEAIKGVFKKTEVVSNRQWVLNDISFKYRYKGQQGEPALHIVMREVEFDPDGAVIQEFGSKELRMKYSELDKENHLSINELDKNKQSTGIVMPIFTVINWVRSMSYQIATLLYARQDLEAENERKRMEALAEAAKYTQDLQSQASQKI